MGIRRVYHASCDWWEPGPRDGDVVGCPARQEIAASSEAQALERLRGLGWVTHAAQLFCPAHVRAAMRQAKRKALKPRR